MSSIQQPGVLGLGTSSVLVLDDDPGDAVPFLSALARRGIGAIYLNGDVEQLPPDGSVRGIRLAVCDIQLVAGSASDDELVQQPLSVLRRVFTPANGPYMVLLWTSKQDLRDNFEEAARQLEAPPVAVCALAKADVIDGNGDYEVDRIIDELQDNLARLDPLWLVMLWGQAVHDAASHTLEAVAPPLDDEWPDEMRTLLGALVRENTPRELLKHRDRCIRGLFDALDAVHADHLEHATLPISEDYGHVVEQVARIAEDKAKAGAVQNATVNRSLLLGPVLDDAAPGTLYRVADLDADIRDSLDGLRDDTLESNANGKEGYEDVLAKSIELLIELTPVCDFQQGNQRSARLMGGLAIPADLSSKFIRNKAAYLRILPPLAFKGDPLPAGEYGLVFNARYLITLPRQTVAGWPALYRVRRAPLEDIFAFYGSHATRPGYLALR